MRNVRLKTFLLMIWFGALVLALGWVIGYLFGNVSLWMTIALVMALVQIWASYWYSDKIVLTMTGTRLVDPNESVEAQMLYNIVEELSIAAGLPMPKVASWRPWSPTPLPQEEIQIMRWSLPHVAF